MENTKITRDNITKHLIEYQLQMVGKSLLDTSGASSGEYNPRNDSMFGKGLAVLLRPSSNTTTPLKPTTTTTSSTPNFTKGIF